MDMPDEACRCTCLELSRLTGAVDAAVSRHVESLSGLLHSSWAWISGLPWRETICPWAMVLFLIGQAGYWIWYLWIRDKEG